MHKLLCLTILIGLSYGCATTTILNTTSLSQAAKAEVKLKKGANDNATGTLEVEHLPPASALGTDRKVYSVWIRSQDGMPWTNMGQMRIDDSRSGEFQMQAPYEAFDILVTAETIPTAVSPSEFVVLRGKASI